MPTGGVAQHESRFTAVANRVSQLSGVARQVEGFGWSLSKNGRVFAMGIDATRFVVRLSVARVEALIAGHAGRLFVQDQPSSTEAWLEVQSDSDDEWVELAKEALAFASVAGASP